MGIGKEARIEKVQNKNDLDLEQEDQCSSQRDLKKEKISYLLQNHICEETVITKCSIPMDFKFKNKITK